MIWVFISEIFPNSLRAAGQSFGSATHWVFAALVTLIFPVLVSALPPGYVFLLFMGIMVLQLAWVALQMPETRGLSPEKLEQRLANEARPSSPRPSSSEAQESERLIYIKDRSVGAPSRDRLFPQLAVGSQLAPAEVCKKACYH